MLVPGKPFLPSLWIRSGAYYEKTLVSWFEFITEYTNVHHVIITQFLLKTG
jgi:hypothetical protein